MRKFVCGVCGYEYKEEDEGRVFEELPEDWMCPMCEAKKDHFTEIREKEIGKVTEEDFIEDEEMEDNSLEED